MSQDWADDDPMYTKYGEQGAVHVAWPIAFASILLVVSLVGVGLFKKLIFR